MIDLKTKWICITVFTASGDTLRELSHEASLLMERKSPLLSGFIEGIVMTNETHTELLIVTQWESREAWSTHQWDEDVSRSLGEFAQAALKFEFHAYEPITIVRAPAAGVSAPSP